MVSFCLENRLINLIQLHSISVKSWKKRWQKKRVDLAGYLPNLVEKSFKTGPQQENRNILDL